MIYGYARVSTVEQAEGGESLATQSAQIAGYCQMRQMEPARTVFVEGGVSGSVAFRDRPEGARLIAALGHGDAVIATKLDRMFRNARDALDTLESLKARGVSLHLIDLGGDVTGNGISKLVFTILSAVAENERERIAERIRDVKFEGRRSGRHLGGLVPFGYRRVDMALVPDWAQQLDIQMMRFFRGLGCSLRRIGETTGHNATQVKRILDRDPKRWPTLETMT